MENTTLQNREEKTEDNTESTWLVDNYKDIRLKVFLYSVVLTLAMIAIMGAVGFGLDKLFGTYPKFLIGGLLLGYPITMTILRHKFKKYSQKKLKEKDNGKS